MATIAGASGFRGAATLANTRGFAAQGTNLLNSFEAPSLLDVAQGTRRTGKFNIGSSQRARAFRKSLQQSSSALTNSLFSLAGGVNATTENNVTLINALREQNARGGARTAESLSRTDRSVLEQDDGGVSASSTGGTVDTSA